MKKQDFQLSLVVLLLVATFFVVAAMAQEEELSPEQMSGNAIMMSGWMNYSEWFVILTLYPSVIILLFIAFSLHIARPMVVRYLNRMTLRLGADILWEAWIIGRDILILASVGILGVLIVPRIQDDWYTGVLIPAFVLGIITLVYKLVTDSDASKTKYLIATGLTALTLVAAVVPYAIGSLWEEKGHDKFVNEVLIPLSAYDKQQQKVAENIPDIIKDVKDAMNNAINAMEKGDSSTAIAESQKADAAHDKLGDRLNVWDSTKNALIEDAFNDLMNAAKKSDIAGMKTARDNIQKILDEFEATL